MDTSDVTESLEVSGRMDGLLVSWNNSMSGYVYPINESMGRFNNSQPSGVLYAGPYGHPETMDPMIVLLQDISNKLSTYAVPAYCVGGILGNFLSCAFLSRGRLWGLSAAYYLIAIQASDIAFLMNLLIGWLGSRGVAVYSHGGMCHFTTFLSHGSTFLSIWYLVCFTIDGFIRISFPGKAGKMCTVTRANVVILALAAVAIAVFINISITFGVSPGSMVVCGPLRMFLSTLQILFKIDIFLNAALPDIAILYLMLHAFLVALCRRDPLCCSCESRSSSGSNSVIMVSQQQSERDLEIDYRRLYFFYVSVSLCLNFNSQVLRLYYTVYGLLYPNIPLTLRDFMWQEVFIHTYYLRCSLHFLLFFCFSYDFRLTIKKSLIALAMSLAHLCGRGNSVNIAEAGSGANINEDETVTSLMKDANSTTPV